jgi:hypothetical protein
MSTISLFKFLSKSCKKVVKISILGRKWALMDDKDFKDTKKGSLEFN